MSLWDVEDKREGAKGPPAYRLRARPRPCPPSRSFALLLALLVVDVSGRRGVIDVRGRDVGG